MINFFKFMWMAAKPVLSIIGQVILFGLPATVGFTLAFILKHRIEPAGGAVIGFLVIAIGYWLYYTIPRCIKAVKYLKETGSDSLKEAWSQTSYSDVF